MLSRDKPAQENTGCRATSGGHSASGGQTSGRATSGSHSASGSRISSRGLTTRRLALSAMLAALALIFSYVEVLIPVPVPIPGVKLGIANLVIVMAIYKLGFRYAFTINCVRIVIAGLLFSGVFGMLYSFVGGILSIIVMYLLYRTGWFSMVGVSMAGGVAHNLGQLITAALIVESAGMMSYFSILLFSGLISGILIGILATLIYRRLPEVQI